MLGLTATSRSRTRLLAALLVVVLLVCHGLFGAFHELYGSATPADGVGASAAHAAGGMVGHGGGGTGEGVPGHLGAADYAAVIVLLIAASALSLPRFARPVRLPPVVGRLVYAPWTSRLSLVFTAGTDPPFSQVFRL